MRKSKKRQSQFSLRNSRKSDRAEKPKFHAKRQGVPIARKIQKPIKVGRKRTRERKMGGLEEKRPHFCKFFLPGVTDEVLRIPPAFLRYIKTEARGVVSLMGPNKNIWRVDLVENTNGLYLQDGWKQFVRDHHLKVGYFLVFKYDSNLRFTVQIFDTSGCETVQIFDTSECENDESFHAKSSQDMSNIEEDVESKKAKQEDCEVLIDYVDISSWSSGEENQLNTQESAHEKAYESCKTSTARLSCGSQLKYFSACDKRSAQGSRWEKASCSRRYVTRSSYMEACGKKLEAQEDMCKKSVMTTHKSMETPSHKYQLKPLKRCEATVKPRNKTDIKLPSRSLISQRRSVMEEERVRALDDAKLLKLENPSVIAVMRPAYVYYGFFMGLPRKFATTYLPKRNAAMTVWDPSKRRWKINYIGHNKMSGLSAGWSSFSLSNNLEEGDVCVFELIEKRELQVHIFRVVEETTPLVRNITRGKKRNG